MEDVLMKLVICDDEIKDAKRTDEIIRKLDITRDFEIVIRTPQDVKLAVEEDLFRCDILVMDIQYQGEQYDGIELTQLINEKLPACQTIFLTNILDFAPYVYETKHCYFVMKENIEIMLPRAVEKAIDSYKDTENDIIEFVSNGHTVFLSQEEIVYIERNNRVLIINTAKKDYHCYTSLRKLDGKLGNTFGRCHAGFIVNLAYVSGIEGNEVLLKDGRRIPVGMRFFDSFKIKYLKYFSNRM